MAANSVTTLVAQGTNSSPVQTYSISERIVKNRPLSNLILSFVENGWQGAAKTCRSWRYIARQSVTGNEVQNLVKNQVNFWTYFEALTNNCPNFKTLDLQSLDMGIFKSAFICAREFGDIFAQCPQLTTFMFPRRFLVSEFEDDAYNPVGAVCSDLFRLLPPNLTSLVVATPSYDALSNFGFCCDLPALRKLTVTCNDQGDLSFLATHLYKFPLLQELRLEGEIVNTSELCKQCPTLRVLAPVPLGRSKSAQSSATALHQARLVRTKSAS